MGTPADVVKARMMNQPTQENGRGLLYKNSIDCLMQTIKQEGFFGLYKGFLPCWLRMAPWSLTFWLSFEQITPLLNKSFQFCLKFKSILHIFSTLTVQLVDNIVQFFTK